MSKGQRGIAESAGTASSSLNWTMCCTVGVSAPPPLLFITSCLGGLRASTLDGTCVWKIGGFSGSYWKPTSPCPFLLERPVLGSSQRDGTSAADAMVEKIQFQKILKNLRLFVKNHSCIATSRPLPGSQQLPLVLQTTPLAPQVPPGSTPIDGGGILLFLDFRHFRPLAPHTRPPRTLYVRSTTDPTPKASLSPFFSI